MQISDTSHVTSATQCKDYGKQEHDNGDITDSLTINSRYGYLAIEPIDTISNDGSPDESHGDIAWIVYSKVKARPAVYQRIANEGDDKPAATHQQREE